MVKNIDQFAAAASNKRKEWPWERTGFSVSVDLETKWPRLTIIMPSYNQGNLIEESIRSVFLQDYPNLEFMIIDGGSSDNSLNIIKKYSNSLSYWESKPDKGQAHAINKGMRLATGEFASWLNSDDYLFPGALFAMGSACLQFPNAVGIYGAGTKVLLTGEKYKDVPPPDPSPTVFRHSMCVLQPSLFFRLRDFFAVGGLDESLHFAMDWDLLLKLQSRGRFSSIIAPIAMQRCYPESKTSSGGWKRELEIAQVAKKHFGYRDRNVFSAWIRGAVSRKTTSPWVRYWIQRLCIRLWGDRGFMIHGWPDNGDHQ